MTLSLYICSVSLRDAPLCLLTKGLLPRIGHLVTAATISGQLPVARSQWTRRQGSEDKRKGEQALGWSA